MKQILSFPFRSSKKIRQNWGWEAWRLTPAGMITPLLLQEPGPTRVVGRPKGSYMCFFLPEVEVGLKSRNNGLSNPTGVVPNARPPAIAGSFTTLLFVMGECALLE